MKAKPSPFGAERVMLREKRAGNWGRMIWSFRCKGKKGQPGLSGGSEGLQFQDATKKKNDGLTSSTGGDFFGGEKKRWKRSLVAQKKGDERYHTTDGSRRL